jgi:hypothetical protein
MFTGCQGREGIERNGLESILKENDRARNIQGMKVPDGNIFVDFGENVFQRGIMNRNI